jgi:hypothetical protein
MRDPSREPLRDGKSFTDLVVRFYQYQRSLSDSTHGYLVEGSQSSPVPGHSGGGGKGFVDLLWVNEEDDYVVIIEVKNTDWDKVEKRGNVERYLRRHIAQVWSYLAGDLSYKATDDEKMSLISSEMDRSAAILYPKAPSTPGLRERIEEQLETHAIQPIWFDEPPAIGDTSDEIEFTETDLLGLDGAPLDSGEAAQRLIITDIASVNRALLRSVADEPERLYQLAPRQFEEVVASLLERQGYEVTLTPVSKDGGIDIYVASKTTLGSFLFLVQCKRHAPKNPVGVAIVRELYGVVQQERANAGILVTTSFFTRGAKAFQQRSAHQLSLMDYGALRGWLCAFRSGG